MSCFFEARNCSQSWLLILLQGLYLLEDRFHQGKHSHLVSLYSFVLHEAYGRAESSSQLVVLFFNGYDLRTLYNLIELHFELCDDLSAF